MRELIVGTLGGLSYGKLLANLASVFILGLGVIAALNQVGIATTVTTPVLIAVLATDRRHPRRRCRRWAGQADAVPLGRLARHGRERVRPVAAEVRSSPDAKEQAKAAKASYEQADEHASDSQGSTGSRDDSGSREDSGTRSSARAQDTSGAHTAHSAAQTEQTSEIRIDTDEEHQGGRDDLFRR